MPNVCKAPDHYQVLGPQWKGVQKGRCLSQEFRWKRRLKNIQLKKRLKCNRIWFWFLDMMTFFKLRLLKTNRLHLSFGGYFVVLETWVFYNLHQQMRLGISRHASLEEITQVIWVGWLSPVDLLWETGAWWFFDGGTTLKSLKITDGFFLMNEFCFKERLHCGEIKVHRFLKTTSDWHVVYFQHKWGSFWCMWNFDSSTIYAVSQFQ